MRFRFREFQVYKDAIEFRIHIKDIVKKYFPSSEKFLLTDQIIRALNSIILNIAEGSDRGTDKDFALFLNRAHTSLNEVVACLDLALQDGFISQRRFEQCLEEASRLGDQITAFRRRLLLKPSK